MFTLDDARRIARKLSDKAQLCPKCKLTLTARLIEGRFAIVIYCSGMCDFSLLLFDGGKFKPRNEAA